MPRSRMRRKSRPSSIISTSSRFLIRAMNGRNASRPGWPLNRSSGLVLDVATTTTPRSNSAWNSRPRIIASAMSLTWNSSKHSSAASLAMLSASGGIGSTVSGCAFFQAWMRPCTSCMKR